MTRQSSWSFRCGFLAVSNICGALILPRQTGSSRSIVITRTALVALFLVRFPRGEDPLANW